MICNISLLENIKINVDVTYDNQNYKDTIKCFTKEAYIYDKESLNFVKTNYNASDLVSVVLSGMFKYSRYNVMAFTARTFVFGRSKKRGEK